MISKEEMKLEALKRMEMLDIHAETIRQFKDEGLLSYSVAGVNYWFSDEHKNIIDKFEKSENCLVYYGLCTKGHLDPMMILFYVSNYGEDLNSRNEWLIDRHELHEGNCLAYVHNLKDERLSEIGYVSFKPLNGGLIKI
jgi:hypothetical protein